MINGLMISACVVCIFGISTMSKAEELALFQLQGSDFQPIPGTGLDEKQTSSNFTDPALLNINGIHIGTDTILYEVFDSEFQYSLNESKCDSQPIEYRFLRLGRSVGVGEVALRSLRFYSQDWTQPSSDYISMINEYACSRAELLRREDATTSSTFNYTGMKTCRPYDSRDIRPIPSDIRILEASLTYGYPGYILNLAMENTRQQVRYQLDNKLLFNSRGAYSTAPMEINEDGKFSLTLGLESNICSLEGIANYDNEVAARLFGSNESVRIPIDLLRSQLCLEINQASLRVESEGDFVDIPTSIERSTLFLGGNLRRCVPEHINGTYIFDPLRQPNLAYQMNSGVTNVVRSSDLETLANNEDAYLVLDELFNPYELDEIVVDDPYCLVGVFYEYSVGIGYSNLGSKIQCDSEVTDVESLFNDSFFYYPN